MKKELYGKILEDLVKSVEGVSELEWQDIIDKYGLGYHEDTLRKAFNTTEWGGYKVYKHMLEKVREDYLEEDMSKLMEKEFEVLKKTKRANTLYNFVHKKAREEERVDMWYERIVESIEKMPAMRYPTTLQVQHKDIEGVVAFSDLHFGDNILIKGLDGEIINSYNEEEFKIRMWHLMEDIIDAVEKERLNTIHIMALADYIEGIMHMSQLQSLQYGIVDGVIKYSEIMAQWLNELSEKVRVVYHQCNDGNHDQARVMTGKKGDFPHENVGKLVYEFIKVRLSGNDNVTISQSKDGYIYENIKGLNFFGYHGEDKNQDKAHKDLEDFYGIKIDIMLSGHLHNASLISCGKGEYGDIQCIRVPSICGTNSFAKSIKKNSSAGAMMFIVEEGKGKTITYDFWLN